MHSIRLSHPLHVSLSKHARFQAAVIVLSRVKMSSSHPLQQTFVKDPKSFRVGPTFHATGPTWISRRDVGCEGLTNLSALSLQIKNNLNENDDVCRILQDWSPCLFPNGPCRISRRGTCRVLPVGLQIKNNLTLKDDECRILQDWTPVFFPNGTCWISKSGTSVRRRLAYKYRSIPLLRATSHFVTTLQPCLNTTIDKKQFTPTLLSHLLTMTMVAGAIRPTTFHRDTNVPNRRNTISCLPERVLMDSTLTSKLAMKKHFNFDIKLRISKLSKQPGGGT